MQTIKQALLGATSALVLFTAAPNLAKADELTLCWAAWDPANALVELSKDFTTQSGTTMKFEFVPWPNFADRILNELNSGGKLCDLLIGDSQWLGGSAENGYYVKLNDFFDKEGIKMSDFADAAVNAYATWPKGTPTIGRFRQWAMPMRGSTARTGSPSLRYRAEFKQKYGRDLAAPATWDELKQVAEFFNGREIDGKKVYGAAIFTERASEGITMGATWRSTPMASSMKIRRVNTTWKARSIHLTRSPDLRHTRRFTNAARHPDIPMPIWVKASMHSNRDRWRWQ